MSARWLLTSALLRATLLTATLLAALAGRATAATPEIEGEYESPLGRVRVVARGSAYRGVLVAASDLCAFKEGDEVLRTTLLDDSLAGQVRICLAGKGCPSREEWSSAVLLASADRLSGAVHVATRGCKAPLGKRGGLAFVRVGSAALAATPPPAPAPAAAPAPAVPARRPAGKAPAATARVAPKVAPRIDAAARERARTILRDGAAWLNEGNFEQARRRFQDAIAEDAGIPEAYNGVGVTYRMRNDLGRALEWYKKALAVDPDFGDAYYNMACVYALQHQRELALRYLQIAALNGYATAEGMDGDPDLESVRADPAYQALVRQRM